MHEARFALGLVVVLLAGAVTRAEAAPVLTLTYQPTKVFFFTWTSEPGANHYKLLEDPTGSSGFTQVGFSIAAPSISAQHIVPLYRRINARYLVQACNFEGCIDSNVVTVSGTLAQSIGYFKASNPANGDEFGRGVALSSDGTTLVVGARFEDSAATGVNGDQTNNSAQASGAVYVFVRTGSGATWLQQAYIKASNTNVADHFGRELALSANGSTLAVGADREDGGNAPFSGAVYVYVRVGSAWEQQAYIKASNAGSSDAFGSAVALSGDGRTLAVGATGEDSSAVGVDGNQANNSASNSGAAYVFVRSGSAWSQQAYIKASNTGAADSFGVALDLSNDGSLLAVSASGEDSSAAGIDGDQLDNSAIDAGAVYVYERLAGSLWTQQAYIKGANTEASDVFGGAVALSNDGATLAVGAFGEDSNAVGINGNPANNSMTGAGAAYVFVKNNGVWGQVSYVKASNTAATATFGRNLALAGNAGTLAVGSTAETGNSSGINGPQVTPPLPFAGAVYVY